MLLRLYYSVFVVEVAVAEGAWPYRLVAKVALRTQRQDSFPVLAVAVGLEFGVVVVEVEVVAD